jgi:hypothetical protein
MNYLNITKRKSKQLFVEDSSIINNDLYFKSLFFTFINTPFQIDIFKGSLTPLFLKVNG